MNTSRMKSRLALRPLFASAARSLIVAGIFCAGLAIFAAPAQAQYDRNRHGSPGMQQADRHNPFAQGGGSVYGPNYNRRGYNQGTTINIGGSSFGFGYGYPSYGYPYYGGAYYNNPYFNNPYYYGSYSPYGAYYAPSYYPRVGPIMYPPIVLPDDTIGPRALERFFNGTNANNNPPVIIQVDPAVVNAPAAAPAANAKNAAPEWAREVSLAMRERAWRFIEMGDTAFQQKDYRTANERYRAAARAAPRVVEAYLKQAQAMIALERYDQAVDAYDRALALPPLWVSANFSLSDQYGPEGGPIKEQHLNQIAAAAEKDPNNANLLLLLGMELFYDQQPDRAVNFLRRAQELGGQAVELPADGAAAVGDDVPIPNPPPVGNDRRIF